MDKDNDMNIDLEQILSQYLDAPMEEVKMIYNSLISRTTPMYSLVEILRSLNTGEIRSLAKVHRIKYVTRLKKEELISKILEIVLDEEYMRRGLFYFLSSEWKILKLAYFDPEFEFEFIDVLQCERLISLQFMRFYEQNGKVFCIIPTEIREVFDSVLTEDYINSLELCTKIKLAAAGCSNLYGAISVDEFIKILDKDYVGELKKSQVLEFLSISGFDYGYYDFDEYIINDWFTPSEFNDAINLAEMQKNVDRYIPPFDELLSLGEPDVYFSDINFQNLCVYIEKEFGVSMEEKIMENLGVIISIIKADSPTMSQLLGYLESLNVKPKTHAQKIKLVELLQELNNNTRIWKNNGFTPLEIVEKKAPNLLRELKKLSIQPTKIKPHPNSPCPCGSGKKYKFCCKQNNNN